MGSSHFKFKQFTVWHDRCAMKIGTDGVLLGAWASQHRVDALLPEQILDVGTGTGVIALMLAQRFPKATIRGIELDSDAAKQATENVVASPWSNRISICNSALQVFQPDAPYDLIVSNPPFFIKSLKSGNSARDRARHTDTLPPEALLKFASTYLTPNGKLAVIYPTEEGNIFKKLAHEHGMHLVRQCAVLPTPAKPVKRLLLEFSPTASALIEETLTIELSRHSYSEAYQKLTQDFYLAF